MNHRLSPGQLAQVACILEATARKPGNVHRFADFADCTYLDFILSASAIAGPLDRAREIGVGAAVLEAVEATRRVVSSNTNLGMVLLLAPLAAVPEGVELRSGVLAVLERLTTNDARHVYQAIRLAAPGGLGDAPQQDVRDEPTVTLRDAMRLAAGRDSVARQYANGFAEVFDVALPALREAISAGRTIEEAIFSGYLHTLSQITDSLIARKLGLDAAAEASRRASWVLDAAPGPDRTAAMSAFDAWLRADGHTRNPGTTADLTTAALFAALREGTIEMPLSMGSWGG
jgi:triphosphoribosyl-dephospho-CoA synthase